MRYRVHDRAMIQLKFHCNGTVELFKPLIHISGELLSHRLPIGFLPTRRYGMELWALRIFRFVVPVIFGSLSAEVAQLAELIRIPVKIIRPALFQKLELGVSK